VWNEWHVLFDTQRSGWLSDVNGNYVMTFLVAVPEVLPAFQDIQVGQYITLMGQNFQVTNFESATCVAGEGELPFKVGAGYVAPVVDLVSSTNFASIDYSDEKPMVYIGEHVRLGDLRMTGLRERKERAGKAQIKSFNCPTCAAPLTVHAPSILSVACGSCGSVVDTAHENHKVLSRFQLQSKYQPLLPLGTPGHFLGADYDVLGYLRQRMSAEGVVYEWSEYLLFSEDAGYCWLTEYQGHWNASKVITHIPKKVFAGKLKVNYLGTRYEHFQTAKVSVAYVIGEFNWQVKVGDHATVEDYVSPPYMLSMEKTGKEITWSLGEYIPPAVIEAAFKPPQALPIRIGVAANQPSPHVLRPLWKAFAVFALMAFLLQTGFSIFSQHRTVLKEHLVFNQQHGKQSYTSPPFAVTGTGNLVINHKTSLDNNWVYLDMQLVERDSGKQYVFGREISYYSGWDSDGSWSEGSRSDDVTLASVPPGNYILEIEAEMQAANNQIIDTLEVVRDVPEWTNFLLLFLWLSTMPLVAWWRHAAFETRRWAESDYAPEDSEDDSDDD